MTTIINIIGNKIAIQMMKKLNLAQRTDGISYIIKYKNF